MRKRLMTHSPCLFCWLLFFPTSSGQLELESQTIDLVQTVEQAVELSFRKEHQLELLLEVQHGSEFGAGLSNLLAAPSPAALPQMSTLR